MPLVKCPDCNTSVSDRASECPKCKRPGPFAVPTKKKSGCLKYALIIVFSLFIVSIVAISVGDRQREAEEKRVSQMTVEQRSTYYKEQQEKAAALEERRKAHEAELEERRKAREAEEARKKAAEKAKSDERWCRDGGMAFVMSQSFIKRRLKAPASASFPSGVDRDVETKHLGDCTHEVWAYVDSQNSFGAKIRTRYYAKLKYDVGTGNWQLLDSKFYE
jgi:hypothetical protein